MLKYEKELIHKAIMKRLATLGAIAQFSKFLNLQTPIGKMGQKLSPARELVRRMDTAGERLVQKGGTAKEGAYVLNQKGKAGKYVSGEARSVNFPFKTGYGQMPLPRVTNLQEIQNYQPTQKTPWFKRLLGKKPQPSTPPRPQFKFDQMQIMPTMLRPKAQAYMLHNHPDASSVSLPDLMLAKTKKNQIVAFDPYGSKYRAYGKDPQKHYQAVLLAESNLGLDVARLKNLQKQGYTSDEAELIITQGRNKALKNMGLIHYSSKIKNPIWNDKLKAEAELLARRRANRYRRMQQNIFGDKTNRPEFPDAPMR